MARNPGRIALYEAISKSRRKQARRDSRQRVVRLRPGWFIRRKKDRTKARPQPSRARYSLRSAGSTAVSSSRRRSYVLAVLIAVVMVLIVLGAVKLARIWTTGPQGGGPAEDGPTSVAGSQDEPGHVPGGSGEPVTGPEGGSTAASGSQASSRAEGNVIVITTYGQRRDLEPVQQHFAAQGVATEIVMRGDRYFLVTQERYTDNPARSGTPGYAALQRIKEIGAAYKAPEGYEPFGSRPFQDAYGMKVR